MNNTFRMTGGEEQLQNPVPAPPTATSAPATTAEKYDLNNNTSPTGADKKELPMWAIVLGSLVIIIVVVVVGYGWYFVDSNRTLWKEDVTRIQTEANNQYEKDMKELSHKYGWK